MIRRYIFSYYLVLYTENQTHTIYNGTALKDKDIIALYRSTPSIDLYKNRSRVFYFLNKI